MMDLSMDNFVSKLRDTVSQVAYQVNNSVNTIIPGNLIHREYETLKLRCSHGCPGFVWSVHDAVKRDSASIKASLKDAIGPISSSSSTNQIQVPNSGENNNITDKQLYSVFVFDKNQLNNLNKSDREAALRHIKNGVTQLTRLRHPSILTVHHPIEESRSSLAFVTEHVFGHLESILLEQRNFKKSSQTKFKAKTDLVDFSQDLGPKDSDYSDSCQLDEIQIKAGLLQVCDGLKFLHNDAEMLHRNLSLNSIFVNSNNTWKISGFEFSVHKLDKDSIISPKTDASLQIVEFSPKTANASRFYSLKTLYPALPAAIVPNWSCSAPEHSNSDQVTYSSDIFSLGIISCALLGRDYDKVDLSYEYGLISDTYKRGIHFRELADGLPVNIKTSIMKYAAINVDSRPSLEDYINLNIFTDQQVQAVRNLDSQCGWDRLRKIDFFNSLRDLLPKLSHQVRVNRVAKALFNELINPDMMPHVLPNILIIARDSTPTEFKLKLFPNLKAPFRVLEPKSVPIMLLDSMAHLADRARLCLPEFQQSAFTLMQYLLRMDQQLQEKCLNTLPNVKKFIDDGSMSNMILPELSRLHLETNNLQIRVKCFDCICQLIENMEKSTVVKVAIPIILNSQSKDPEVIIAATNVLKTIVNNSKAELTKDDLAGKILPFLIPLSIERNLNSQQFQTMMVFIRQMLDRVEREQRETLAKKGQPSGSKSGPLLLDNFKGSNHFIVD